MATNDNNKKEEAQIKKLVDGTSPFFLHPSDNPGTMISSCMLKGDNYNLWKKAMRNAL
jgi:gag-polypeptide of LTR copia-type